jgi:hypothetical protein
MEFRPTLQAQPADAERKGLVGRQRILHGLLKRRDLNRDDSASPIP